MTFDELFARVCEALQREQRISYRALRRRFALSGEDLADLQDELIPAKQLAVDEDNRVLVWVGAPGAALPPPPAAPAPALPPAMVRTQEPLAYTPRHLAEKILTSRSALEGERKQVTVLFCDLQNSTAIAAQIGPDNMHTLLNRFFDLALWVALVIAGLKHVFPGQRLHGRRAVHLILGHGAGMRQAVFPELPLDTLRREAGGLLTQSSELPPLLVDSQAPALCFWRLCLPLQDVGHKQGQTGVELMFLAA
jgi:hypothetical protein